MKLEMHALEVYRLAMRHPDRRHALLTIAAALHRAASRTADRTG